MKKGPYQIQKFKLKKTQIFRDVSLFYRIDFIRKYENFLVHDGQKK